MLKTIQSLLKRILPLILTRKNAPRIVGGLALTAGNIGINILSPEALEEALSLFTTQGTMRALGRDFSAVDLTGIYGGAYLFNNLLATSRDILHAELGASLSKKLATRYTQHRIEQSLKYQRTTPKSVHDYFIQRCYTAPPSVTSELFNTVIPTTAEVIVAMALLSWWYGLEIGLSLGLILVVYFGYNIGTNDIVNKRKAEMLKKGMEAYRAVEEICGHYEIVHAFSNIPRVVHQIDEILDGYAIAQGNSESIIPKVGLGQTLVAGLGFIALMMAIAEGINSEKYQPSDLVFVSIYLLTFCSRLERFGKAANQLSAAITEIDAILNRVEEPSDVIDRFPQVPLQITPETADIEFDQVSFDHEGDAIIKNVSFKIPAGSKVGIVGMSGVAAKTTLANLLFRFIEPKSGVIRIGGHDISQVGLGSLREKISIVPQEADLFNNTIYHNVAYGKQTTLTRDQAQKALQDVDLWDVVSKKENGLNTMAGENGKALSGGQRQRVAIARAMVKDTASIYIFDEATSGVDSITDDEIQKTLDKISEGKTAFFITHRLKHLLNANLIIVLDQGEIADLGTHDQLLSKPKSIYARLWRSQNGAAVEEKKQEESPPMLRWIEEKSRSSQRYRQGSISMFSKDPVQGKGGVGLAELEEINIEMKR